MYGYEGMGHGFFMPWMIIFPIMLLVFFMMMRSGRSSCHHHEKKEDEALEIARKRFARGEIDEEAFEKIKQKLSL
jgi:putative membrane protein